jgi:hypothetical protein
VVACWTLVDGDWDLVANKSGPTRLGVSLMLKFFELEGRFPEFIEEFPQPAVEYVASAARPAARERSRPAPSGGKSSSQVVVVHKAVWRGGSRGPSARDARL